MKKPECNADISIKNLLPRSLITYSFLLFVFFDSLKKKTKEISRPLVTLGYTLRRQALTAAQAPHIKVNSSERPN